MGKGKSERAQLKYNRRVARKGRKDKAIVEKELTVDKTIATKLQNKRKKLYPMRRNSRHHMHKANECDGTCHLPLTRNACFMHFREVGYHMDEFVAFLEQKMCDAVEFVEENVVKFAWTKSITRLHEEVKIGRDIISDVKPMFALAKDEECYVRLFDRMIFSIRTKCALLWNRAGLGENEGVSLLLNACSTDGKHPHTIDDIGYGLIPSKDRLAENKPKVPAYAAVESESSSECEDEMKKIWDEGKDGPLCSVCEGCDFLMCTCETDSDEDD